MQLTERDMETAEALVGLELGQGLARIRESLAGDGGDDCSDCGRPIPSARRRAMPSATRCIACQTKHERAHP